MDSSQGIPMICATSVMKPGRARIGRISKDITLPRTIPIVNLVAAGIGMFLGLALAVTIGDGIESIAVGLGLGGGAGWMAVTYSPLKNESLLKWFELKVKSQTRARYVNGRRVILAVGTGVVDGPSSGSVLLLRSAVRVTPGQYDERGVVRSVSNMNLEHGSSDPALLSAASLPPAGAVMLPDEGATSRRALRTAQSGRRVAAAPAPAAPRPSEAAFAPYAPVPTVDAHEFPDPLSTPAQSLKD